MFLNSVGIRTIALAGQLYSGRSVLWSAWRSDFLTAKKKRAAKNTDSFLAGGHLAGQLDCQYFGPPKDMAKKTGGQICGQLFGGRSFDRSKIWIAGKRRSIP
ncbi:hypothetical protein BpHYR1_034138 [Brachionus plicatilis]|uniref:Uncharacterized protein n=1 Tax=Brachionus plicatilis TaxID=10195 RepID=A0A3M7S6A1_BRAPC|nr:hypothetical protein BpHYR1_034138 [Brachionus plicatilis]